MRHVLCCVLIAVTPLLASAFEPYKWEKVKVKLGRGKYQTLYLDHGILRLHRSRTSKVLLDGRKLAAGAEILERTKTIPNVPNTTFGVIVRVAEAANLRAEATFPKAPKRKGDPPEQGSHKWELRTVADATWFAFDVTPGDVPGKVPITVYVEDTEAFTVEFHVVDADQTYTNAAKGFSIEFPPGWKLVKDKDAEGVLARSPKEGENDNYLEHIDITGMTRIGRTSSKGYRRFIGNVLELLPGFKKVDSGTDRVGRVRTRWMIYTYTNKEANKQGCPTVKALFYFLVKGEDAFLITATAAEDAFDRYRPVFDKSIQSFRLHDDR